MLILFFVCWFIGFVCFILCFACFFSFFCLVSFLFLIEKSVFGECFVGLGCGFGAGILFGLVIFILGVQVYTFMALEVGVLAYWKGVFGVYRLRYLLGVLFWIGI